MASINSLAELHNQEESQYLKQIYGDALYFIQDYFENSLRGALPQDLETIEQISISLANTLAENKSSRVGRFLGSNWTFGLGLTGSVVSAVGVTLLVLGIISNPIGLIAASVCLGATGLVFLASGIYKASKWIANRWNRGEESKQQLKSIDDSHDETSENDNINRNSIDHFPDMDKLNDGHLNDGHIGHKSNYNQRSSKHSDDNLSYEDPERNSNSTKKKNSKRDSIDDDIKSPINHQKKFNINEFQQEVKLKMGMSDLIENLTVQPKLEIEANKNNIRSYALTNQNNFFWKYEKNYIL